MSDIPEDEREHLMEMLAEGDKIGGDEGDLLRAIAGALLFDRGRAARESLAAGFPIYYCEDDTPEDWVIREYPDGRRELVKDVGGDEEIRPLPA